MHIKDNYGVISNKYSNIALSIARSNKSKNEQIQLLTNMKNDLYGDLLNEMNLSKNDSEFILTQAFEKNTFFPYVSDYASRVISEVRKLEKFLIELEQYRQLQK